MIQIVPAEKQTIKEVLAVLEENRNCIGEYKEKKSTYIITSEDLKFFMFSLKE